MVMGEKMPFDSAAEDFRARENTVRGQIRYQVVRRNLEPLLAPAPLQVLDMQGGSGPDTAWLARLGHNVTLVEESEEQRRFAAERFNELPDEARGRIQIIPGGLKEAPGSPQGYDLVLCHAVAQYQNDPVRYIRQVALQVKPGGLFSVLEKNYRAALMRAVRQGASHEDLLIARRDQRFKKNNLGLPVYGFKPRQLYDVLMGAGLEVTVWSGVRVKYDKDARDVSSVNPAELELLVTEEYLLGLIKDYRGKGQLLHFVTRRPFAETPKEAIPQ